MGSPHSGNEIVPNDDPCRRIRCKPSGDDPMTFLLFKDYDHYTIRNEDTYSLLGHVYPLRDQQGPYRITSSCGSGPGYEEIGIVNTLDEAIPTFLHYYKKTPIEWERKKPALYWRRTMYVELRVEQDQQGHWLAYRDGYPMLENGFAPAWFKTCADAKRAADAHELYLFPNAEVIDDGYSWLPDPEIPDFAEESANWRRDHSDRIVWLSDGHATTSSPN
jgi:hypothetical protein